MNRRVESAPMTGRTIPALEHARLAHMTTASCTSTSCASGTARSARYASLMPPSNVTNGARSRLPALSLAGLLAVSAACESTSAPSSVAPDAQLPDASATDGGSSHANDAEAGAGDAASVPPVDAAVHDASEPHYSIVRCLRRCSAYSPARSTHRRKVKKRFPSTAPTSALALRTETRS